MLAALVASVGAEESLETIFEQYGTDKQADFHGYVHAYSMLLGPWRHHVQSLLEVGIGTVNHSFAANMGTKRNYSTGASLYSWRRYLPNARIVGLDLDAAAAAAAADKSLRIEAYGVDTTSGPALAALDLTNGGRSLFDVVIDDGLHTWKGQQQTLTNLWPLVRPGGFYFIEDVVWGDLTKHATPGGRNPVIDATNPRALAILREGGAYSISLDAFWKTLSKHRFSTIIALQKPERHWPLHCNSLKGVDCAHNV